ncbi:MAG: cell division protein SepF [Promethearchaeota archaeon]
MGLSWLKKNDSGMGEVSAKSQQYGTLNDLLSLPKIGRENEDKIYYIRTMDFSTLDDVKEIIENLKKGYIMILNAKPLLNQTTSSVLELKRSIEQLRGFCNELGGSIGRLGEDMLIITPDSKIRIY